MQSAIDNAASGDTIVVAPGIYKESLRFNGRQITVQGSGPATVLHGGGVGPVVTFANGESRTSVLKDLMVTGGGTPYAGSAGGILVSHASPTIQNVSVENNEGCGVGVFYGAPVLRDSHIAETHSQLGDKDCLPSEAHFSYPITGGLVLYGSSTDGLQAQVVGNVIERNQSQFVAGGIFVDSAGQPLFENNTIRGNRSSGLGAGVSIIGDTAPILIQNRIIDNTLNPTLTNPALADAGAGLNIDLIPGRYDNTPIVLSNNTIAGNSLLLVPGANEKGSQVFLGGLFGKVQFYNNVIVGASSQIPFMCSHTPGYPPQIPVFDHNDVFAEPAAPLYQCDGFLQSAGNTSADPLFASGPSDPTPYTLQLLSPAVDAGTNAAPHIPSTDIIGHPRIQNARNLPSAAIDMGAYEYAGVPAPVPPDFSVNLQPPTLFLSPGTSGSVTASVTPLSGTLGLVSLACTYLPAGATCSFSPATIDLSDGASHMSTLTVHLSPTVAAVDSLPRISCACALVPAMLLLGCPLRRRKKLLGSFLV